MSHEPDTVGWDVGGAHLKVAWVNGEGHLKRVYELATPLWRGLECLDGAVARISEVIPLRNCRHRLTMTGELVDLFSERAAGVAALIQRFVELLGGENLKIYAGPMGFVDPAQASDRHAQVASANWFATASLLATRLPEGLLVDVGSTTSDLLVLQDGLVINQGYSDLERLASEELIYAGVVRTSLMAICQHAPFRGDWVSLANEHFATTADVYRVLDQLPAHADLHESADGQGKSITESIGRLARVIGADRKDGTARDWRLLARYFCDRQLDRLALACQRRRSSPHISPDFSHSGLSFEPTGNIRSVGNTPISSLVPCELIPALRNPAPLGHQPWTSCPRRERLSPSTPRQLCGNRRDMRASGINDEAPLIGAGVGRFLVEQLAARLALPYLDIETVMNWRPAIGQAAADCAPAIAVAMLAQREAGSCAC